MRGRLVALICLICLPLSGCWDRIEMEDQLFLVSLGLDQGRSARYRVTARAAIIQSHKTGLLGGREGGAPSSEILTVEADDVAQAIYIMNSAVARRITTRHIRAILVGEAVARGGVQDLWADLSRNPEIRSTTSFFVARGTAEEMLRRADWTGDFNPAKVIQGVLLVEKQLHIAPPVQLHHMINRSGARGIHPFASVVAINRRITGEGAPPPADQSAQAGSLPRFSGNPVEIAGTAIFRDNVLKGFLTVDETQALLALRGEMGKAYVNVPNPFRPEQTLMIRFHQENRPWYRAALTPAGPQVQVKLLFEGEVLSGRENYMNAGVRDRVEKAARKHMDARIRSLIAKLRAWEADPVGFGLHFRSKFATWKAWDRYRWSDRLATLQVDVVTDVRIRRQGLILGAEYHLED